MGRSFKHSRTDFHLGERHMGERPQVCDQDTTFSTSRHAGQSRGDTKVAVVTLERKGTTGLP